MSEYKESDKLPSDEFSTIVNRIINKIKNGERVSVGQRSLVETAKRMYPGYFK